MRDHESFLPGGPRQPGTAAGLRRFPSAGRRAQARAGVNAVAADAGFDSEANHRLARDELGIQSLIPAVHGRPPAGRTGRPLSKANETPSARKSLRTTLAGRNRQLDDQTTQRRSRQRPNLLAPPRLLLLKVLTHNISILRRRIGFLLSTPDPFNSLKLTWQGHNRAIAELCHPSSRTFCNQGENSVDRSPCGAVALQSLALIVFWQINTRALAQEFHALLSLICQRFATRIKEAPRTATR